MLDGFRLLDGRTIEEGRLQNGRKGGYKAILPLCHQVELRGTGIGQIKPTSSHVPAMKVLILAAFFLQFYGETKKDVC